MGSSFNGQILVEKLAKLNNSQASIETLSNWCIFHMNKAKHVVETWDRQFHCAPRDQRLAYLYLANDILQNSRRKGSSEFVGDFLKVLPDALRDVIENGDDFGRKSARRLVNIWEERKVFGSHGQILRELLGKQPENGTRNGTLVPLKLSVQQKQSNGSTLEKVVFAIEVLHGVHIDEDAIVGKYTSAAGYLEKAAQEFERDLSSGHTPGPAVVKEVQGQHAILRDCIEQLGAVETSRTSLISHLREALQEQELKLEQVRNHLQIARFQSDWTGDLCRQLLDHGGSSQPPTTGEEESKEAIKGSSATTALQSFTHSDVEESAPVMFASNPTQSVEDPRKTAAAAVVAKLTASTSSAEMLSYVFSSLASEGIITNNNLPAVTESPSSVDYPPEKRPKLQNHDQSYLPPHHQNAATTSSSTPPPPLPPPLPPPPYQLQPQFLQPLQPPGPVNHTPFNYTISTTSATMQQQQQQQQGPWVSGLTQLSTTSAPSEDSYQMFQEQDGLNGINFSVPMTPVTRQ